MTRGVRATRAQVKAAAGQGRAPAPDPAAAAAVNRNVGALVLGTGAGRRRDRPLQNTRLLNYHGLTNGNVRTVPPQTSIVFITDLGKTSSERQNLALLANSDCQRVLVGRLTPGGHRMFIHRYNQGERYPDLSLSDERTSWRSGTFGLPLRPDDLERTGESYLIKAPTLHRMRAGRQSLRSLLADLGPGKYVVNACRNFAPGVTEATRRHLRMLERDHDEDVDRRSYGGASDAGSLSRGRVTTWRSRDDPRRRGDASMLQYMRGRDTSDTATSRPRGAKVGGFRYPRFREPRRV